jgi:NitT/TauT family transport system substrate-binding protein
MRISTWPALPVVLLMALVAAACGGNAGGSSGGGGSAIKLGFSAWPGWFPWQVAKEAGIFEKAGVRGRQTRRRRSTA